MLDDALLRAFITLSLIAIVLFGISVFVRRYTAQKFVHGDKSQFRMLGHLTVRPKHTIGLLLVGEKIVVVGMTDQSMTPLTEITDPSLVQQYVEQSSLPLGRGSTGTTHPLAQTSFVGALRAVFEDRRSGRESS
jgi:flagellar biogenesis protein FliO